MAAKFKALCEYNSHMSYDNLLYLSVTSKTYRLLSVEDDGSIITWTITGQGKGHDDFAAVHKWLKSECLPLIGLTEQLKDTRSSSNVGYRYVTAEEVQELWSLHDMQCVRAVTREERNEESPILRSCLFIYKIQFGKICIPINRDVPIASFEL